MRILLIRHAESTWNAESRWQGWADPPLSAQGLARAKAGTRMFKDLNVAVVVASDLSRARSTAETIASELGLVVSVDAALRERNVGLWTGMTSSEVEAKWPGHQDAYRSDPDFGFPDGEDAQEAVARTLPFLAAIAERGLNGVVAIAVSHGGLIRCIRRALGCDDRPIAELGGCWIERDTSRLHFAGEWEPGHTVVSDATGTG